jgi:hypothetical protein
VLAIWRGEAFCSPHPVFQHFASFSVLYEKSSVGILLSANCSVHLSGEVIFQGIWVLNGWDNTLKFIDLEEKAEKKTRELGIFEGAEEKLRQAGMSFEKADYSSCMNIQERTSTVGGQKEGRAWHWATPAR